MAIKVYPNFASIPNSRESEPKVICFLSSASKQKRYIIIGTEYRYIHNIAGDIREWNSYSCARRFLLKYLERI